MDSSGPASATPDRGQATGSAAPRVLGEVGGDGRIALRSRLATASLVLILLAVSVFAVWSSQVTARAARQADAASRLSDDFASAASAVAAEESLERKYRLDPTPEVRARYDRAAAELVAAAQRVRAHGAPVHQNLMQQVLLAHNSYLLGVERMFAAVDAGSASAALRIDGADVDPSFDAIETSIDDAANAQHVESLARLGELRRLEAVTSRLTPGVFLVGLLLAGLFASVTREYRRLLDAERSRALHDSLHDALTGLPNRTLLAERTEQALRNGARTGTATGLLLIDLDRFKEINDTFGHHYGDGLLAQVGTRLTAALRAQDTVARLGGDEFAVLLPGVAGTEAACAVAATLREALTGSFVVDGVALDVEASIGVAQSGEHGSDAATLLQRADVAMYVAKEQNLGVCAYDPALDEHSPARLALLGDLRRALETDQLVLHYQPKVSVDTGEVVGAEALIRWQHPDRGLLFPDAFIPLAEYTGLLGPLTHYVLDAALAQARRWRDAGRPLMISVNLSARSLLDEALPQQVAGLLAAHSVPAELLELEVTESAIMTEPARATRLLRALADLGIRLSLDDFGAGYTSLGQLRALPITELKIDKSFVLTMTEDASNRLIVSSVVDLGHHLGLTIVAEGVETEEALTALRGYGCDIAQGYHLSRPIPADAFDLWWDTTRRASLLASPIPSPREHRPSAVTGRPQR